MECKSVVVGQEPRAPDTIHLSGAQTSPSGRRAPDLRGQKNPNFRAYIMVR